jgi:hypothetical protein
MKLGLVRVTDRFKTQLSLVKARGKRATERDEKGALMS